MKVTVEFDIDLDTLEAELRDNNITPTEETVNRVVEEIKGVVKGTGEDSDAIYDAVDTILDERR